MDSQFLLDRSPLRSGNGSCGLTEGMEACTEGNGDGGGGARVYTGGGAGGKLRSSRRGFSKKTTPYDRPASDRHATAGGACVSVAASSSSSSSTIASRLMGSASLLISSSASYFFPSFFGRKAIAITNGNLRPEAGVIAEEQDEKEEVESPIKQVIQHGAQQDEKEHEIFDQGRALVTSQAGLEKNRLDVAQVEEMLKQKTWSREQVKRLTDILQTRVIETTTNTHAVEAAGRAVDIAGQAVETITGAVDDKNATPISEAQRWREELKKARTDFTPIEVARAYMGERTSRPSRLTPSFRGPAHQIDRVVELPPPPVLGLLEDRYRASPVQRSWTRSPAIRAPKRSSFLDEDWVSVGPVRRTRQKTFQMVNSIPYARGMAPGESAPPRTYTPPPIQSSQTARKILDTLEKLTPSPKGNSLDEKFTAAIESKSMSLTPDTYNVQARKHMQKMGFPRFSNLREPGSSHSKLDFEIMAKSPMNSPTLTLGAVKESTSEEKSQVNSRLPSSSEAGFPNLFSGASSKSSRGFMAASLPCTTAANASVTILAHSSAITVTSSGSPAAAPLPAAGSHSQNVASSSSAVPTQPESKPLFSWSHGPNFSFSSAATENRWPMSSSPPGGSLAMPPWPTPVSTPATVALPAVFMTPVTHALSTAAAPSLVSSAREQHSEGDKGVATEAQVTMKAPEGSIVESNTFVKEPDKSSNSSGSNPFQFGPPISGSTFSFKIGNNSSPFSVMGAQSSVGLAFPFRAQSETLASSSSSFSKTAHSAPSTMFGSLPASVSVPSSFAVMTTAASSTPLPAQSNPFPSLKPSAAGQLFSGSQITKPTAILSLTIEASNASFTFSPSHAPVSCSTPTFPFGSISSAPLASSFSSAGQFLASNAHTTALEASPSPPAGASNSGPVFSFTSPSGEPKLPALSFGSNDISLPSPTFTFGSGALPLSSSTGSLTVGGQTSSSSSCGQLFGSATGLASAPYSSVGVSNSPPQVGLEFSAGFASGASGLEKSGRKFLKAKRRK